MKTQILTMMMFSSMIASAGTLQIEPSRAFNEAFDIGLKAALIELALPHQNPDQEVRVTRQKNILQKIGDYEVEVQFNNTSVTPTVCIVDIQIKRQHPDNMADQEHILEEDLAMKKVTTAMIERVRCD